MARRHDWDHAFELYAAMPAGERSYQRVADTLGTTKRVVERAATRFGWPARMRRLDERARVEADRRLVRARADRVTDTLRIIDAARTRFAGQLGRSEFRLTGSDFVGLVKLEQLLEGEATDHVALVEVQAGFRTAIEVATATAEQVAAEVLEDGARAEFVRAFRARFLPAVNEALAVSPGGNEE